MPVDALADLMKKLNLTLLKKLVEESKTPIDEKTPKKGDYIDALIDWSYEHGIVEFVKKIDLEELKKALQEVGEKVKNKAKDKVQEQLLDAVSNDSEGLEGFLNKMEVSTLQRFVEVLDFETDAKSKKQFADDIADEILLNGTRALFNHVKLTDVKEAAKLIGVQVKGTKEDILDRILNIAFPGILQEEDKKPVTTTAKSSSTKQSSSTKKSESNNTKKDSKTNSKKKNNVKPKEEKQISRSELNQIIKANRPPIDANITKEELFQNYWDAELKEYCVNNELKKSGTKNELIKRILQFLKDPTDRGYKKTKKRPRARSSSTKRPKKKARTDKKEDEETEEKEDTEVTKEGTAE